jgi:hypothetical protein
MANDNLDLLEDAVAHNAKSIDTVLWTFLILEFALVYLKLTSKQTFSWSGFEVNATGVRPVSFFLLLTVAHLYTTLRLVQSIRSFSQASNSNERRRALLRVTSSGGLFMRGLIPRTQRGFGNSSSKERFGCINVFRMEWRDLTTLPSYLAALGIIGALLPIPPPNCVVLVKYLGVGFVIVVINWLIGSKWAITLSQLANGSSQAAGSVAKSNAPLSL